MKNDITLYAISSSGHKGTARKKYEMCTISLSSSTLPCSLKQGFSWACFDLFSRTQWVATYTIFPWTYINSSSLLWLGNLHRSLPISGVLCQYDAANRPMSHLMHGKICRLFKTLTTASASFIPHLVWKRGMKRWFQAKLSLFLWVTATLPCVPSFQG